MPRGQVLADHRQRRAGGLPAVRCRVVLRHGGPVRAHRQLLRRVLLQAGQREPDADAGHDGHRRRHAVRRRPVHHRALLRRRHRGPRAVPRRHVQRCGGRGRGVPPLPRRLLLRGAEHRVRVAGVPAWVLLPRRHGVRHPVRVLARHVQQRPEPAAPHAVHGVPARPVLRGLRQPLARRQLYRRVLLPRRRQLQHAHGRRHRQPLPGRRVLPTRHRAPRQLPWWSLLRGLLRHPHRHVQRRVLLPPGCHHPHPAGRHQRQRRDGQHLPGGALLRGGVHGARALPSRHLLWRPGQPGARRLRALRAGCVLPGKRHGHVVGGVHRRLLLPRW